MHNLSKQSVSLALVVTAVTGCAGDSGAYPSLALRPFETGTPTAAPAPAPEPIRPVISPAALAGLRAEAAAAHAAYLAREGEAERLARAARGQPFESDARAAALVALADLDSRRGTTAGALARLDTLAGEAAATLASDPALTGAQTEVAALVAREDAGIARLWDVLGS